MLSNMFMCDVRQLSQKNRPRNEFGDGFHINQNVIKTHIQILQRFRFILNFTFIVTND